MRLPGTMAESGGAFLFVTDHDRQILRSHAMKTSLASKRRSEGGSGKKRGRSERLRRSSSTKKRPTKKRVDKLSQNSEDLNENVEDSDENESRTQEDGLEVPDSIIDHYQCTCSEICGHVSSLRLSMASHDLERNWDEPSDFVIDDQLLSIEDQNKTKEDLDREDAVSSTSILRISPKYRKKWIGGGKGSQYTSLPRDFSNFDPFQTCPCELRRTEQALIHHWIYVFGTMMFGTHHKSNTNPMSVSWIPDALNDDAAFQGMLSYAAAHMAHLKGQEGSVQAMMYKSKAIQSIQSQINDPETAVSDSTVGAILRQISIEDRFGSLEVANMHRTGLAKIIEKRGGADSFSGNWNLELLYHWYLITSKPMFGLHQLRAKNPHDTLPDSNTLNPPHPNSRPNLPIPLTDFWTLFQALGIPTPLQHSPDLLFPPTITLAPSPRLLKLFTSTPSTSRGEAHDIIAETCKLACLLYIAVVQVYSVKHNTKGMVDLNSLLVETQTAWDSSPETLLWVLLRWRGEGDEGTRRIREMCELMKVAKLLQRRSWNVIKEMLICVLWRGERKEELMDGWMSLVTELVVLGISGDIGESSGIT